MNKPKSPCVQDCPDRDQWCHCRCEKNLAYERDLAKWREEDTQRKQSEQDYISHALKITARIRKSMRGRNFGGGI